MCRVCKGAASKVRRLGGDLNTKSAIRAEDEAAVLAECERGVRICPVMFATAKPCPRRPGEQIDEATERFMALAEESCKRYEGEQNA